MDGKDGPHLCKSLVTRDVTEYVFLRDVICQSFAGVGEKVGFLYIHNCYFASG